MATGLWGSWVGSASVGDEGWDAAGWALTQMLNGVLSVAGEIGATALYAVAGLIMVSHILMWLERRREELLDPKCRLP